MNFKTLTVYTVAARKFEASETHFATLAANETNSLKALSLRAKSNFYGIEARKMRGGIAAVIFGFAHYKGAEIMADQKRLNPCYA